MFLKAYAILFSFAITRILTLRINLSIKLSYFELLRQNRHSTLTILVFIQDFN